LFSSQATPTVDKEPSVLNEWFQNKVFSCTCTAAYSMIGCWHDACRLCVCPRSAPSFCLSMTMCIGAQGRCKDLNLYRHVSRKGLPIYFFTQKGEEARKLDLIAVQGHPRSSTLVSIESAYAASY